MVVDGRVAVPFSRIDVRAGTFTATSFVEVSGRFDGPTSARGTYIWKDCLTASGQRLLLTGVSGSWRAGSESDSDVYGRVPGSAYFDASTVANGGLNRKAAGSAACRRSSRARTSAASRSAVSGSSESNRSASREARL